MQPRSLGSEPGLASKRNPQAIAVNVWGVIGLKPKKIPMLL